MRQDLLGARVRVPALLQDRGLPALGGFLVRQTGLDEEPRRHSLEEDRVRALEPGRGRGRGGTGAVALRRGDLLEHGGRPR